MPVVEVTVVFVHGGHLGGDAVARPSTGGADARDQGYSFFFEYPVTFEKGLKLLPAGQVSTFRRGQIMVHGSIVRINATFFKARYKTTASKYAYSND